MKIAVLTTDTPHHAFAVQQLAEQYPVAAVINETEGLSFAFPTAHPFEIERDSYEWDVFFGGQKHSVADFGPCTNVSSINDAQAVRALQDLEPDIILTYGTRKILEPVASINPTGIINLHGADPEVYRGLDSHLWAIHLGDFDAFSVTLHRLTQTLDGGDILAKAPIEIPKGMKLSELRAANARVCIRLVLDACAYFERHGQFAATPQRRRGAYYSAMPAELKQGCVERFEAWTKTERFRVCAETE